MASIRGPTNAQDLSFDAEALKAKYREERDKRLNDKGMYQYREIEDVLRHYADDPYSEPILRLPVDEEVEALVIGGGYGGLLVAVRLIEAGIKAFGSWRRREDFRRYMVLESLSRSRRVTSNRISTCPCVRNWVRAN